MPFDAFEPLTLPIGSVVARLILASFVGAAIGFERERRDRAAGLRTHMLVALAAAIFSLLMLELLQSRLTQNDRAQIDPVRVLEAITTGVSFIAAGVIIRANGRIKGLTTGAGLWLAGALGAAAGIGFAWIALIGALFGFVIIAILRRFEPAIRKDGDKDDSENQDRSDER